MLFMELKAKTGIKNMNQRQPANSPISFVAAFFIITLCVVFGANTVAIKISLTGLGPFFIAGIRFGLGALTIALWMRYMGKSIKIKKQQMIPIIIVSLLFTIQIPLFNVGLTVTTVSRAVLITNIQPFIVLILAHFFIKGDQLNVKKLSGILLGFIGIIFVVLEKQGSLTDFRFGDIVILISAILWACSAVYSKNIIDDFDSILLALYPMLIASPLLLMGSYFWDETSIGHINWQIILSMSYQTFLSASIGFVIWMTFVKKYGAVSLNTFLFVLPVSGVLLGGLILNEPITYKIILALIFVALGLMVTNYKSKSGMVKI
jgi:drug/metabolite transporter (DMT)-like permease